MTIHSARLFGNSAYLLFEAQSPLLSREKAADWGGYLAVITDGQENQFLTEAFSSPAQAIYDSLYTSSEFAAWDFNPTIGYTKDNDVWNWSWADGSQDGYRNWHSSQSRVTADTGDSAALYLIPNGRPADPGKWVHDVGGKTAIAELKLQPVFSFDRSPNEGHLFTTSVELVSANEANSDAILALDGIDVYWSVDGLSSADLDLGSLSGSAKLTNGSISVAHKLRVDADLHETYRLNLFSDEGRTKLIGRSQEYKLAPSLLSIYIRDNNLTLIFSEAISISGSGVLNPALISVIADGQQRATGTTSNENISQTSQGYELKIPLAGWGIDKASRIDVVYSLNGLSGNDGFIIDGVGNNIDDLSNFIVVDNSTFRTSTSISSRGLANAYKNLVLEGSQPISGFGNSFDNIITGNSANNIINGMAGVDTMFGGLGDDLYIVDNLGDLVVELADAGIDSVHSSVSYTLSANVENLSLIGSLSINGFGNELSNTINGNAAANILNGGLGADTLIGGTGSDTYYVDSINDVIIETGRRSDYDTVYSSVNWTLGANLEKLVLVDNAITGIGNNLDNYIIGNNSDNVIDGGISGRDTLTGGLGADMFMFSNRPSSFGLRTADIITDFNSGEGDLIVLSRNAFNFSHVSPRISIVPSSAAYNQSLRSDADLIYNSSNGWLTWNQNGTRNGVGSGGIIAVLENLPSNLTSSSFTFV